MSMFLLPRVGDRENWNETSYLNNSNKQDCGNESFLEQEQLSSKYQLGC